MSTEPFDASALLDELQSDAREFTLHGETFTLLPPAAWPDAVIDAANRGDALGIARMLLGDDYDRYAAAGGSAGLLERIVAGMFGTTVGESAASSPS